MSLLNSTTPSTSGAPIDLSSTDWTQAGVTAMRGLLVGVAGNVTGRQAHDTIDVVYPLQAGINPLRFIIIRKTGTTATSLVALY